MTRDEALDVRILLRWMGWHRHDPGSPVGDGVAADTLVALAAATNRHLETQIDHATVLDVFERHCERLRGTAEAEQVCEAIDAELGGDVVFESSPRLTALFDQWKQARAEVTP